MKKLKALLKGYFAAYEASGLVAGNPRCTSDELAEAIVAARHEPDAPPTPAKAAVKPEHEPKPAAPPMETKAAVKSAPKPMPHLEQKHEPKHAPAVKKAA